MVMTAVNHRYLTKGEGASGSYVKGLKMLRLSRLAKLLRLRRLVVLLRRYLPAPHTDITVITNSVAAATVRSITRIRRADCRLCLTVYCFVMHIIRMTYGANCTALGHTFD